MNTVAAATVLFVLALSVAVAGGDVRGAGRPNVLLVLVDDLGSRDVRSEGSLFHETPQLDALARGSARFRNAYSSHPVCSPTRAALQTGKVPQRLGITDWIASGTGVALPAAELTLGEAFRAAGYQTAYLGKWHLGEADADQPDRHGYEWTRGVNRAGQPASYYAPFRQTQSTNRLWDVPDFVNRRDGEYLTDVLTEAAIEFLRQRDVARPFLMCLSHYAVHTPLQPPGGQARLQEERRRLRYGSTATPVVSASSEAVTRARQDDPVYAAMVENLDANMGRLLAALDELGLSRNTVVVFTSDNGGLSTLVGARPGPTCNLPWRAGKGWTYEGGIRVPLWIRWPGTISPGDRDTPAVTADLYPTLLELCGLPPRPSQHLDGASLVSALEGSPNRRLRTRSLAWFYPHRHGSGHVPGAALRRGSWKLVYSLQSGAAELYDLEADPGETRDLARDHPRRTRALLKELQRWIAETQAQPARGTSR